MIELRQTETFRRWWTGLKDERAVGAIFSRLDWLGYGLVGDAKTVGDGVSELRIHYGPGTGCIFKDVDRR